MIKIRKALISVTKKDELKHLAKTLQDYGISILSTEGTYRYLKECGTDVTEISEYTGTPEILGGRVKTLDYKIYGGILAVKDKKEHLDSIKDQGIDTIDLVVVNFYTFLASLEPDSMNNTEQVTESIDVGGPAMVRAAAKNYRHTIILTDPADYASFSGELVSRKGHISTETSFQLAQKAFALTAAYDATIANYWGSLAHEKDAQPSLFPRNWFLHLKKQSSLRYGENPHQSAASYTDVSDSDSSSFTQIQGKDLSYNNIADAQTAWSCVRQFSEPSCVIVKHCNPCSVASDENVVEAYKKAYMADSISAFGGIIAINRAISEELAEEITKQFAEVVVAPQITENAKKLFARKEAMRVLFSPEETVPRNMFRKIGNVVLVQTQHERSIDASKLSCVTEEHPNEEQLAELLFAWKVAQHVRSNATVVSQKKVTLGIGTGQTSRIDSVIGACMKACDKSKNRTADGAVAASDGFFPFSDNIDTLADAGVVAVIQPGGSKKDEEVIEAANRRGMAMIFTKTRLFSH